MLAGADRCLAFIRADAPHCARAAEAAGIPVERYLSR